jgi:hypothetical protein
MDKYSMDAWSSLKEEDPVMLSKGMVEYLLGSVADLQDLVTILILTVRNMQVKNGAVDLTNELEDYLAEQAKKGSDDEQEES